MLATWTLHYGAQRGGAVGLVLTLALTAAILELWRTETASFPRLLAWALGWQTLTHSEAVLSVASTALPNAEPGWTLGALPLIAAALIRLLVYLLGTGPALCLACSAAATGPGWTAMTVISLAVIAMGLSALRVRLGLLQLDPRIHRLLDRPDLRVTVGLGMALAVLPATYPWLRARPADALLEMAQQSGPFVAALVGVLAAVWWVHRRRAFITAVTAALVALVLLAPPESRLLIDRQSEVLQHGRFRIELPLSPEPVHTVILETDLVHGAHLKPGTEVIRVFIDDATSRLVDHPVYAGIDTDDWASGRPDLAQARGQSAAAPWSHRVTDDGQFFRQTFRTVIHFDQPIQGERLILRRMDALPEDVMIRVHRVEVRP